MKLKQLHMAISEGIHDELSVELDRLEDNGFQFRDVCRVVLPIIHELHIYAQETIRAVRELNYDNYQDREHQIMATLSNELNSIQHKAYNAMSNISNSAEKDLSYNYAGDDIWSFLFSGLQATPIYIRSAVIRIRENAAKLGLGEEMVALCEQVNAKLIGFFQELTMIYSRCLAHVKSKTLQKHHKIVLQDFPQL